MSVFIACILTILIETPFLARFGYRSKDEITVIVCANAVTNLLLNLSLTMFIMKPGSSVYLAEIAVTLSEYAVYALAFGASKRLFFLTLAATVLSFMLSYPLFYLIRFLTFYIAW